MMPRITNRQFLFSPVDVMYFSDNRRREERGKTSAHEKAVYGCTGA